MLAERLYQVVHRHPEAIAIRNSNKVNITYSELWRLIITTSANIDKLFENEKYIGMVADQDVHAIIASIAVMLTGRVLVPIDPRHEPTLIEQMFKPFTSNIICGSKKQLGAPYTVYSSQDITQGNASHYSFSTQNTDAYILHTSGTTGQPKPVLADQAALCHVAEALVDRYHITPSSKVLQFAYLSFDSSLIEIWSTLFGGGTIVVAGERIREDLYGCLEGLLKKNQITVATLPSAVASSLSDKVVHHFDTLILAGDECPIELANRLHKQIPHLINAYGPTESIICATTYEIDKKQDTRVSIGKPLPGMNIIIDNPDTDGRGEMTLVSSYVAKGYANDAARTKHKFGLTAEGRTYYKSGDVGRMLSDGNYEFLGRIDNQVKINGQRVELEGVEAQIRRVTKRDDIAVVAVEDKLYCLYRSDVALDEFDHLPNKIQDEIPSYAIPSTYLPIANLPLDLNGKIDRNTLRTFVVHQQHATVVAARQLSNAQSEMISLWANLLVISEAKINAYSSFFSLGGDSLSALKLVKTVNDRYKVTLRLSEVIADPATPDSVIAAVERHRAAVK